MHVYPYTPAARSLLAISVSSRTLGWAVVQIPHAHRVLVAAGETDIAAELGSDRVHYHAIYAARALRRLVARFNIHCAAIVEWNHEGWALGAMAATLADLHLEWVTRYVPTQAINRLATRRDKAPREAVRRKVIECYGLEQATNALGADGAEPWSQPLACRAALAAVAAWDSNIVQANLSAARQDRCADVPYPQGTETLS